MFIQYRLISVILVVSLLFSTMKHPSLDESQTTLAPQHFSLDIPITQSFLDNAVQSENPNERVLAKALLAKQKSSSGLFLSFSAAFVSAFSIIGQEAVLTKTHILEYALLQAVFMTALFVMWLRILSKKDFFSELSNFFPLMWRHKGIRWFFATVISHQIIRNSLVFYSLTKIGSIGINMIAPVAMFFIPFLELILLGVNKFKLRYFISYSLIFAGVLLYKMTSVPGLFLILLGVTIYFFSALENVMRKKIVEIVGEEGRTNEFTLSFLIWNYFSAIFFWTFVWINIENGGFIEEMLPILKGASFTNLIHLILSPFIVVIVLTAGLLVGARYLEQKARTIRQFPVAFLEAIKHSRIVFTAIVVSIFAIFSNVLSVPFFSKFVFPTRGQWLSIPIILGGVTLLSYFHYKENGKEKKLAKSDVIKIKGRTITQKDWLILLAIMHEWHSIKNPKKKAMAILDSYFRKGEINLSPRDRTRLLETQPIFQLPSQPNPIDLSL